MKKHNSLLPGSLVLIQLIAMPAFSSSNTTTSNDSKMNVLSSVELNSQLFKKINPQKIYPQVASSCYPWPECENIFDDTEKTTSTSKPKLKS